MVKIDQAKCIQCGLCADICTARALSLNEESAYICKEHRCFRCAQCVTLCPVGAITMENAESPIPYDSQTFDLEPEKLLNAMRFRRSIRRFTGEKISQQKIEMLLEAGRVAPTSSNSQSVRFTVLDTEFEALRPKIWKSFGDMVIANGQKGLARRYEAYLAAPDKRDGLFYGGTQMLVVTSKYFIDGCLALANMELLAHTMGIGTLYCGMAARAINRDAELREYFGITEEHQLCGCLIIGQTNLKFHRTAPRNPAQVDWK